MRRIGIFWLISLTIVSLAGCSQQSELTLRQDQSWELSSRIELDLGLIPDISAEFEGIDLNFDLGAISAASIEMTLNFLKMTYQERGLDASWRIIPNSNQHQTSYQVNIHGRSWEQLKNLTDIDPEAALQLSNQGYDLSQNQGYISVTELGDGRLLFVMEIPFEETGISALAPFSFVLNVGKIHSSNANFVRGGKATWDRPQGRLEAIVTPKTPFAIMPILTGVGVIIASLGGFFFIRLLASPRNSQLSKKRPVYRQSKAFSNRGRLSNRRLPKKRTLRKP